MTIKYSYQNYNKRNTYCFYKHSAYQWKNKHKLSILSSLENSCSLLFYCLKSHSEAYSEPCQTSKMKLLPKIINGFYPLNIFTKNFILDVWQGSDYSSVIFSKVAGLQLSTYNFTKRWTPPQVFWQLRRNTYLKKLPWTAASKETDVIKSAVNVYESLYKRCGITLYYLHPF